MNRNNTSGRENKSSKNDRIYYDGNDRGYSDSKLRYDNHRRKHDYEEEDDDEMADDYEEEDDDGDKYDNNEKEEFDPADGDGIRKSA